MKVIGFGWIKTGETLKDAMKMYGIPEKIEVGKPITVKAEKELFDSKEQARRDFMKCINSKQNRRSARPRYFRVILEEIAPTKEELAAREPVY